MARKRLRANKNRKVLSRLIKGKKPMTVEQKEIRKKEREEQRAASLAENAAKKK